MLPVRFFFDTADIDYIQKTHPRLKTAIVPSAIRGITTNPNAMNKVGIQSWSDFYKLVPKLCSLVTSMRQDDRGVVYVQHPNDRIAPQSLVDFAKQLPALSDGATSVGLKIPPYSNVLKVVDQLNEYVSVNVTGVADCATALLCCTYNVRYVSVIPGRMEEKGINANEQLQYLSQRKKNNTEIITGSMRTLDGLRSAILADTVPTIGSKVWDLFLGDARDEQVCKTVEEMWDDPKQTNDDLLFAPHVTQDMTDLSIAFFEQMKDLGKNMITEANNGSST